MRTKGNGQLALTDALAQSELLPGLDAAAFDKIADEIELLTLDAGQLLVEKGDLAEHLFVLLRGQLSVEMATGTGTQQLALLRPGDVTGEIGVLTGDRRSATVRAVSASRIASISAEGMRRLLADHPAQAEDLARRATERLRRAQLIEHFTTLFGIVEPEVLAHVEQLMEWVSLPAGTMLFAQGDDADAAYVVATGRLRAFRRDEPSAPEVEVGEIGRAELVGEMSLVDNEPRSATVYAVRDTQLLRFSQAAYDELLQRYPRVGLEVAQIALKRARGTGVRDRVRRLSFVLVPATPNVDVRGFAEELTAALGPEARRVSSSDIDRELGRPDIAQIGDDHVGALRLAYRLEELEQRHRYLVYEIDGTWTAWSRRALRWADHVVLVADASHDPRPGPLEHELWALVTRQHHPKVSLALLHPPGTVLPSGTAAWLQPRAVASHHHVRRGDAVHMGRLARLLSGTGTSLVLGGGGARGFAHLGVLAVLEELGAPIDMIGGTSIGAVMAVGPALEWDAMRSRRTALEAFRKLFDYTLPSTAVLRGERITNKLQSFIGDIDIEDMWIPYFCVSTNLTHATAEFHDRGTVVPAVRASIAIPGVLPPVPRDGDLLVDGGVLDNVPVGEMRRRNPTGNVIAVDVAPVDGPVADDDYGLWVSGFRSLFRKRRTRHGPPNLVSTMVRSSIIASVRDRQRVVRDDIADLYLDVGVEGGGTLDFSTADEIADSAQQATRPILTEWLAGRGETGTTYIRTEPGRVPAVDPVPRPRTRRRGGAILLTLRDLQYRATRFAAIVAGVSVVFALLFLMTGLTEQFHREPRLTVAAFGGDGWLLRDGASGAFTSAATMPAETAQLVEGTNAFPVIVARHSLREGSADTDIVVVGFQPQGLGEPELTSGRLPGAPGEVVVDDSSPLRIGEEARIGDHRYTVTGQSDRTTLFAGMPLVFMHLHDAQDLLYRGQNLATAVLVEGTPTAVPDGFALLAPDTIVEDATRPLERSISSVNLIRVLLWFVAAMIIGTMTYLSALERRRDVAVLKAVGGSTGQLGASIALQGVLIALVAAVLASVLQGVLVPVFPLEVAVPGRAFVQVPLLAVLVSLVAGGAGLRKAVRTDPALAFAGPGS